VDSTVTQTPILIPADSHLLWDSVRIQARLLEQAQALVSGVRLDWHDRYCPSPVSGQHWYLYLIIDIYSRKIVA